MSTVRKSPARKSRRKRPITAEDLLRLQTVADPQISPDGRKIVFVKKHIKERWKKKQELPLSILCLLCFFGDIRQVL